MYLHGIASYSRYIGGGGRILVIRRYVFTMPTFRLSAVLFVVAALSSSCQQASSSTPRAANGGNSTTASKPSGQGYDLPTEIKNPDPISETEIAGSLATPTESYKTAYMLRKKKDIAGLKKIMSKDILEFLSMMGEAEKKSLDDMLREMVEKPQAEKADTRNEKIKGDSATIEYRTETGEWKTMDFEKTGDKWLLTFPKADKIEYREAEK